MVTYQDKLFSFIKFIVDNHVKLSVTTNSSAIIGLCKSLYARCDRDTLKQYLNDNKKTLGLFGITFKNSMVYYLDVHICDFLLVD